MAELVALHLTDKEAHDVHHALAAVVDLLRHVEVPADAPLAGDSDERLVRVARRLDHERRWKGERPNPHGPEHDEAAVWLCAKCGHGSQEHGFPGHPAYLCVADMRLARPGDARG